MVVDVETVSAATADMNKTPGPWMGPFDSKGLTLGSRQDARLMVPRMLVSVQSYPNYNSFYIR